MTISLVGEQQRAIFPVPNTTVFHHLKYSCFFHPFVHTIIGFPVRQARYFRKHTGGSSNCKSGIPAFVQR